MSLPSKRIEIEIDPNAGLQPFFTLDSPTLGVLDSPDAILGGLIWADVTPYVIGYSTNRGSSRLLDRYNSGLASVVFDNTTRLFDPLNTASPYSEQLLPRRGLRIFSGGSAVYQGIVQDWNLAYNPSGDNTTTAEVADKFSLLAQQTMTAHTAVVQNSGDRVNSVLSRPEVDWSLVERNIDTGQYQMQADVVDNGTIVLDYLNQVTQSEQGSLFIGKNGYLNFQDASVGPSSTGAVSFADDSSGIKFTDLSVVYGSELLYNRISLTRLGGASQIVDDLTSQAFYGITTYEIDNLLNNSDVDVANIADALLAKYANPEYRFDSISIELAELTTGQQNQILGLELTDIVKIKFTPNNIGSPIEKYARIIGISHNVGNFTHKVSLNLDTLDFAPFVLDDPVFGVLGGTIGTTLYNDSTLTYDDLLTYNGNTTTITGYSLG